MKSEGAREGSLIDLDQVEINRLLSLDLQNDDANWLEKARYVYENGMHSGPYAMLTLTVPMEHSVTLPEPTKAIYANSISPDQKSHDVYEFSVLGFRNNGNNEMATPVQGMIRTDDPDRTFPTNGSTGHPLYVSYPEGSTCLHDGSTKGCFAGPTGGMVLQGYGGLDYTYDPNTDNKFGASLKGYSEHEGLRMYYCEHHGGCDQYQEYERYYNFYGILDYGNHWIDAAFHSKTTEFPKNLLMRQGYDNVDFSKMSRRSRNAFLSTSMVSMNVFTMINRLMVEFARDGCKKHETDFSAYGSKGKISMDSVVASWDQAAAIYAGSALIAPEDDESSTESESSSGSLYFHMVRELAEDFGVLEESSEKKNNSNNGNSSVLNRKVLQEFQVGKLALTQGDCDGDLERAYLQITQSMRVPWIQGILRAAFVLASDDTETFDETRRAEERGRAEAYLAALLPDLHAFSVGDSWKDVYDELRMALDHFDDTTTTASSGNSKRRLDYHKIRDALETNYQILEVTCDDVGGLINPNTGGYYKNTRPCGGYGDSMSQRRESVSYNSNNSNNFAGGASSRSSLFGSHKSGLVMSGLFVAMAFFFVSLSVLIMTVRDRAQGRPADLRRTARRLASGAMSQVDDWVSRRRNHEEHNDDSRNYRYQVQLQSMPMASQAPLDPDYDANIML